MIRIFTFVLSMLAAVQLMAQGWPSQYRGVMLQGFYWDSYADTQWTNLESQAGELGQFFKLVWVPQSGRPAGNPSMGYDDLYWFTDYNSSFGNIDQLRSMLNTFKANGIGTIADVVINHRASLPGTWMSFPEEAYNGVTYIMTPADICANDDEGKAAAQAEVAPTGAADSGTDMEGFRDLDHSSPNVQAMVKAYLGFLLGDLGYAGVRYDMVKGYAPAYTAIYNTAARPQFSVGEYWDGTQQIEAWIDGTRAEGAVQSAAFDFPLKYLLNSCCNAGTGWDALAGSCLVNSPSYRRYAVTFVDNHDTYGRGNGQEVTANVVAANAFILAMPGTPCIFLPHWKAHKQELKQLIYARTAAGVSNESTFETLAKSASQYAVKVNGDGGRSVVILMGAKSWPQSTASQSDYFLASSGDNYAYYLSRNAETAWASVPSGTYGQPFSVTLGAVTASPGARLVYTLDGSDPTAASTAVADGATVSITGSATLKVGLLVGGAVTGIITREYKVEGFTPYDITVYVNADEAGWGSVNYYTWRADGSNGDGPWPGSAVTSKRTVDGKDWYCKTYRIATADDYVNFVFSTGTGSPQTVDVVNVKSDRFYEISTSLQGDKHLVSDVTDLHATGIGHVEAGPLQRPSRMDVYTIDGRLVRRAGKSATVSEALEGLAPGVYIVGGKKVIR